MAKKSKKKPAKKEVAGAVPSHGAGYERLFARRGFSKSEITHIGIIFFVALVVRAVYFFINKNGNPLFYHPILDGLFHHEWAQGIVGGNFWGNEVFFRAPLYPYLLAFLYKLSGSSIAFATCFQHIIGSLSVVLVYLLSRQYFSRQVSALAGILASLYWPLIYFEGDLLVVTVVVFLDLAFLLSVSLSLKQPSILRLLISGLLLGLSAVARPSILVFVPVLPFVFYYSEGLRRQTGKGLLSGWHKKTALVIAGSLVVILPVIVRNYIVGRDIVPIASQGGVNFYIGNNPQSNGSLAMVPGARADLYGTFHGAIELAERDMGRELKPSEVSNYYSGKAFDFIVSSPTESGALFMKKLHLFWAGVERSNNKYIQFFWARYGLGRFPLPGFWLVGPLALLGGALLWKRRKELSLLYLFVLVYMAGVVAFFVNARFRLPVTPVLIVFSAYALGHLFYALRSKSGDLFKLTVILATAVFIVDYDFIAFRGVRAIDEAISHYELANAFLKMEDKDSALFEFEQTRAIQEKYPTRAYMQIAGNVDYNLGAMYLEKGFHSRAIQALERIPDYDSRAMQAKGILAECYVRGGRYQDAINTYAIILQVNPNDARSLFGLGVVYRMAGDIDRSEEILNDVLRRHKPPGGSVYLELARTLELKGDMEGAIRNYEAASASDPQRRDAYIGLAGIYKRTGDTETALTYLTQLRTLYPNDRSIQMEIDALRRGQ